MKFIWILSGKKLKQYTVIFVAALFAVGITYAEKDNISVFSQMTIGPSAIYKVNTDEKKLALTFDISWGEERAAPILDILEEKHVENATFFLSAPWSESHPDLVKRIKDLGYEIGSHGNRHIDYSKLSEAEIREQIKKAHRIITEVAGVEPELIRAPHGDINKSVLKVADELGYKVIQWDTDSKDRLNPGVDQIVQNVVQKAHKGDIILMHASDSATQTHLALPKIIDQLRNKGFEFVTVSELIEGTEAENQEIN